MAGGLELDCIGRLELRRNGEVIELPRSKKTRALLAYLALTDRRYSRDRLVNMFWPIPDDPRGALRWSLSKLRQSLDEGDTVLVQADRDTVGIDLSGIVIDVSRLKDMAGDSLEQLPAVELEAAAHALEGELLEGLDLPDCHEFQFWLVSARESLSRLRAQFCRALVKVIWDEPERLLPFTRELVDLEPEDPWSQGALVLTLWRLGERERAEAQYHRALHELRSMEIEPDRLEMAWAERESRPVIGEPEPEPQPASPAYRKSSSAGLLGRPAVAVLPFEEMSGDSEQTYFADGITDEINTALARWRWFPVIARNSTAPYRGRNLSAEEIGAQLGARYVVQGSVRKAGPRVRVIAQLIDAETGLTVWAQRYDGEIEDIFDLQDDIAARIVAEIEPEVARAERERSASRPRESLDAWDLNLRAQASIDKGGPKDLERAIAALDQSLSIDPKSAHTYSLKAYALYNLALFGWTDDPAESARVVMNTARQAVELDGQNWFGHALLGISSLWCLRDYEGAAAEALRAVQLNPTAAMAHQFYGCVRSFDGNPDEAIPHLSAALKLNPGPNSATSLLSDLSLAHLLCGDLDQSVSYARRAISRYWGNTRAWERLAASLGLQGRGDEAAEAYQEFVERSGRPGKEYFTTTYAFRDDAHLQMLLDGLEVAGLKL